MSEDQYRRLARSGLAPLVEDVPDGPEWEQIAAVLLPHAARQPRAMPGWAAALVTAASVLIILGLGFTFLGDTSSDTTPATDTPFDVAQGVSAGEAWWSAVIAGDIDAAIAVAHTDGEFNFDGLGEIVSGLGEPVTFSIDMEVFGSEDQPQLCFTVDGTDAEFTGSLVYRRDGQEWLPWEARSNTERCVDDPMTTTTREAPEPTVLPLPLAEPIPLRVLAAGGSSMSDMALLDLGTRRTTVYPPGSHAVGSLAGAVMTPDRHLFTWTYEPAAQLFTDALGQSDLRLTPQTPRILEGIAPSLRLVPTPDSDLVWLVQPGITSPSSVHMTLVELIEMSSGRRLLIAELDEDSFPVAATSTGLVLNTHDLTEDRQIPLDSAQVLHLREGGMPEDIGPGQAIASSPSTVVRRVCPTAGPPVSAWPPFGPDCELHLSNTDGTDNRTVAQPIEGVWMDVGGPLIPTDAMPLQTVSPEGSKLLVAIGQDLDVNSTPAVATLLIVDLDQGTTTEIGAFAGHVPMATWSSDGQWVAVLDASDIRLISVADPGTTVVLEDVIPPDLYPLAAG